MKTRIAVALGVAVLAIPGVTAASAAPPARTLTFTTVETSSSETSTGFTFRENVFRTGKKIGRGRGVCTVTPRAAAQPSGARCKVTVFLPNGRLFLTVRIVFAKPKGPLTVTGGTGAFRDATGRGTHRTIAGDRTRVTIRLA